MQLVVVPGEPPLNREAEHLESFITPDHFVRCHFAQPLPPSTLFVGGAHPASWSVESLQRLPPETITVTMECAGNARAGMSPLPPGEPWQLGAVSTAVWSGVPLQSLLSLRDDAVEILARGADGFERSLPVEEIGRALVALEMNGGPIPPPHGGPMRLIVPGWYGVASVKWLESIEALVQPFAGHFQTEQYIYDGGAPVTTMRVRSHILTPSRGWAWSGDGPITAVEVSLDSGPWQAAAVGRPLSRYAWVPWQAALEIGPGRHTLRARARDAAGHVQPEVPPWNRLGYGNNAVATLIFSV
jgi:DMSO/TMAO reductase YedYZ molybdopterin-dependent catalytic subunit